jgi:hypothetical protein
MQVNCAPIGANTRDDHLVPAGASKFAGTEDFEQSQRDRKVEMRFAHQKRILKLGRLRLRGPRGAQDEFVLAAIARNLRRLATLVARPPPAQPCTSPSVRVA